MLAVKLIAVAVLLLVVQEVFRRAGKWVAWGVFLGLPLCLTPYWVWTGRATAYAGGDAFPWVKLYSLQVGACWLTAVRFTPLGRSRWALGLLFLMLPLNILEAVTQDAAGGHLAHYLLVLTGVLLVVTVPHPMRAIRVDAGDRFHEVRYVGMTRAWVVWYSLWNWAFVYLNYPAVAGHQLAVLASALVVGVAAPGRWLQARTFTLATDLLVLATFPGEIIPWADTSHWASAGREDVAAGVCLAVMAVSAGRFFRRRGDRPGAAGAAEPPAAPDRGGSSAVRES